MLNFIKLLTKFTCKVYNYPYKMPIFYGGVTLLELEKEIKKINYIKEIEWHTERNYAMKANDCVEILYFEKGEGEIIIGGTKTPVVSGSIYIINSNITSELLIYYFSAFLVSLIVTFLVTKWFREIVNKGKLIYFVVYCAIVGSLVILFL